ncbi:MAG: hypothetical protein HDT30_04970 [Clostridiales bacterium]|nr:hypothetical protein [Clostridiales bacterium]
MLKIIRNIAITALIIGVGVFIYFNIGRPVVFSAMEIENTQSYDFCPNPDNTEYELNLDAFDGKLPSKDSYDYCRLSLKCNVNYRSLLTLEKLETYVESIDTENKKYVIYSCEGGLGDGELPLSHEKTHLNTCMFIYVGDLKSEDAVKERLTDIAHHTKVKILYNIQWLGNKEKTYQFPSNFTEYSYLRIGE